MSNHLELLHSAASPAPAIEPIKMSLRPRVPAQAWPSAYPADSECQRALVVLRKNWLVSTLFMVAVVVSAMTVSLLMKPIYEPEAKIELDPPGHEIFSLQNGGEGTADAEYLETQSQKLQSDELAVRVIRSLRLDQRQSLQVSWPRLPTTLERVSTATPLLYRSRKMQLCATFGLN